MINNKTKKYLMYGGAGVIVIGIIAMIIKKKKSVAALPSENNEDRIAYLRSAMATAMSEKDNKAYVSYFNELKELI